MVAQLVEQYTFNVWALGSSPSQITKLLQTRKLFLCRIPIYYFPRNLINIYVGACIDLYTHDWMKQKQQRGSDSHNVKLFKMEH